MVMHGFAFALEKDDDHISKEDSLSSVVLIRYPYLHHPLPPKIACNGTRLSFGEHQDVSMITVLHQTSVPNLQVQTEAGFLNIPPKKDCFLVNCGTYMAHVTNNFFRAPLHRVVFSNTERLSIPFFLNLAHRSMIDPFQPKGEEFVPDNVPVQVWDLVEAWAE